MAYNRRSKTNGAYNQAMLSAMMKQQLIKDANINRVIAPQKNRAVRTTAKVLGDLSFIIQIKNLTSTTKDYLLWDADNQYKNNTGKGSPTNQGVEIIGTKKNYKSILNQLIGNTYQVCTVNFEVTTGSNSQLDQPIKLYTNSQDNDAAIFQKSIVPSLYKNSQQFQIDLIETSDQLILDMFSAWVSQIEGNTTLTMRIFASSGKSFT